MINFYKSTKFNKLIKIYLQSNGNNYQIKYTDRKYSE